MNITMILPIVYIHTEVHVIISIIIIIIIIICHILIKTTYHIQTQKHYSQHTLTDI